MPRRSECRTESLRKHRLSLAQLASYDDVSTDALVDKAYFWSRIRKNRENKYQPVRGVKEDEVPQILLHKVIIGKDVEDAEKALLNLAGLRRYEGQLRTEAEKRDFRSHLRKYINMYLPDSPFEVSTTNRYTITAQEAAVTARKRIREGDKIKYLCGTLVPLSDAELQDLDLTQRNFSIVQSDRKKNTLIFLGPARFANHDCDANGRLVSVGKDGLEVHATRNIDIGEEITVTYSPGYFGMNNEECLCHTCELQARNGWTSADAFGAPKSSESTPVPADPLSESPYSFRKKRKHGPSTESSSIRQSPSPSKKLKLDHTPSRLNQVFTPPLSSGSVEHQSTLLDADINEILSERPSAQGGQSNEKDASPEITSEASAAAVDQPRKKRMRLIDQMASNAGSSPELVSKSRPSSSIADESGNDSVSSKESSHSTQATSVLEMPVAIKLESSEVSKIEGDAAPCPVSGPTAADASQCLDSTHISSAETTVKSTDTTIITKSSSSIVPSIESPAPDITPTITSSIKTTTTTLTVLPDPTSPPIIRTPGDYILTRRLLALPHDRWVQCQTCYNHFLQSNGYQTRRECPRCERHSMLYGFGWPKTEADARRLREIREEQEKEGKKTRKKVVVGKAKGKRKAGSAASSDTIVVSPGARDATSARQSRRGRGASMAGSTAGGGEGSGRGRGRGGKGGGRSGKSGKGTWVEGGGEEEREERVMDHRTVNRFIAPEDEREARKRGKTHIREMADALAGSAAVAAKNSIAATSSATPDRLFARLRGSVFAQSGRSASVSGRDDSVDSAGFEDGDDGGGVLRRSKRFFGSRLSM